MPPILRHGIVNGIISEEESMAYHDVAMTSKRRKKKVLKLTQKTIAKERPRRDKEWWVLMQGRHTESFKCCCCCSCIQPSP